MPEDVITRVHRGIALLEACQPDWRERVDVKLLKTRKFSHDLLNQIFSNHAEGLDKLALPGREAAVYYGFDESNNIPKFVAERKADYIQLRKTWGSALTLPIAKLTPITEEEREYLIPRAAWLANGNADFFGSPGLGYPAIRTMQLRRPILPGKAEDLPAWATYVLWIEHDN